MEGRIRNLLLKLIVSVILFLPTISSSVEISDEQVLKPVIQPVITRSTFNESKIDTSDFEVIANIGVISIEDFGTSPSLTLKLNYHLSDDFFLGVELLKAKGEETSFEILSGGVPLLSDKDREMTTYLLTLGYNALPGEAFVTNKLTYNTSFYLIGGIGSTTFGGDDHFTVSIGVGYRILTSNFISIYTDLRDNIFNTDIFGKDKSNHNLNFTVGIGLYF